MVDRDWQCGDCGTLVDGPETRKCPNCGGINFYPLADEIPGKGEGSVEVEGDVDRAMDHLKRDDTDRSEPLDGDS